MEQHFDAQHFDEPHHYDDKLEAIVIFAIALVIGVGVLVYFVVNDGNAGYMQRSDATPASTQVTKV
ncbi:hypothetical protein [Chitinimonas sp. BJYL2]|uniref:hypothetical protein n=1 Tax=Chitinimonas sp. BJYL2 TaxID=2976696 RepID=UPI0022B2E13C|nr:hypothetical protein [Chitinimonas sp. BJYL2]